MGSSGRQLMITISNRLEEPMKIWRRFNDSSTIEVKTWIASIGSGSSRYSKTLKKKKNSDKVPQEGLEGCKFTTMPAKNISNRGLES